MIYNRVVSLGCLWYDGVWIFVKRLLHSTANRSKKKLNQGLHSECCVVILRGIISSISWASASASIQTFFVIFLAWFNLFVEHTLQVAFLTEAKFPFLLRKSALEDNLGPEISFQLRPSLLFTTRNARALKATHCRALVARGITFTWNQSPFDVKTLSSLLKTFDQLKQCHAIMSTWNASGNEWFFTGFHVSEPRKSLSRHSFSQLKNAMGKGR